MLSSLDLPTPALRPLLATPQDIRRVTQETAEWVERLTPPRGGQGGAEPADPAGRRHARCIRRRTSATSAWPPPATATSPPHPPLPRPAGAPGPACPSRRRSAAHHLHAAGMGRALQPQGARGRAGGTTADDIALAFLLKQRLDADGWDQVFAGQILSVVRSGMFVLFEDLNQGFLAAGNIPGDYYELDEMETAWSAPVPEPPTGWRTWCRAGDRDRRGAGQGGPDPGRVSAGGVPAPRPSGPRRHRQAVPAASGPPAGILP